ncbi:plastocyanin/azurin family copper-binding protein [Marinomonas sp.]
MLYKIFNLGIAFCLLVSTEAFSKDWQVNMLNYGEAGSMVFEPAYIEAKLGDSVTFIPAQSGHNAKSYLVPEGDKGWASQLNEEFTLSLNHEGVHLFYCPPHLMMGMVGLIKVGATYNKSLLEKQYPRLRSKIVLNPERADAILENL